MNSDTQNRNNKKVVIVTSVAILVIIVAVLISVLLVRTNANGVTQPASIGIKDARALTDGGRCLANNATTKTKVQAEPGLDENGGFWTSYIYDVPAGTNVDVSIATYNGSDTATGSLVYSDDHGSYNFTATKKANEWRYTNFARCQ